MTLDSTTFEVAKMERALEAIKTLVAETYGIRVEELLEAGRAEPRVTHRQVAMYLCRELTDASFPDIARAFGKKDHETVRHACEAIPRKAAKDKGLNFNLERLRRLATSSIK